MRELNHSRKGIRPRIEDVDPRHVVLLRVARNDRKAVVLPGGRDDKVGLRERMPRLAALLPAGSPDPPRRPRAGTHNAGVEGSIPSLSTKIHETTIPIDPTALLRWQLCEGIMCCEPEWDVVLDVACEDREVVLPGDRADCQICEPCRVPDASCPIR